MPVPSSLGPLYQNEVKCSAFDMEMIFHSHANKTHFHKKDCGLGLILKVRVFGTRKWPIERKKYRWPKQDHTSLSNPRGIHRIVNSNKIINLTSLWHMNSYTFYS